METSRAWFDCAQVLVLSADSAAWETETAAQLIREKQFWHVVISGARAGEYVRALRQHSGMPNFLQEPEGSAVQVKALLEAKGIRPRTLAVPKERLAEYAEAFGQAKLFCI